MVLELIEVNFRLKFIFELQIVSAGKKFSLYFGAS